METRMTRLAFLLALLLPAAAVASPVTFTRVDRAPGTVIATTEAFQMDMVAGGSFAGMEIPPATQSASQVETYIERVEAYSADRRVMTVTFGPMYEATVEASGGEETASTETLALQGGSYRLEWTAAGGLTATKSDGSAVSAEEKTLLEERYDDMGTTDPLATWFDGKTLEIGEQVAVPSEVLAASFGELDDELDADSMTLKLTEVGVQRGARVATFEATLTMTAEENDDGLQLSMSMPLSGTFLMGVDTCEPLALDMAGPMSMTGVGKAEGIEMHLKGSGPVSLSVVAVFSRPAK